MISMINSAHTYCLVQLKMFDFFLLLLSLLFWIDSLEEFISNLNQTCHSLSDVYQDSASHGVYAAVTCHQLMNWSSSSLNPCHQMLYLITNLVNKICHQIHISYYDSANFNIITWQPLPRHGVWTSWILIIIKLYRRIL